MNKQYAVATLYKWFQDNVDVFKSKKAQIEFRDAGDGRAYVRVDTGLFMTELLVKDKGAYLDIERIDMDTDESEFPRLGECESKDDFEKSLSEFIEWFEATHA